MYSMLTRIEGPEIAATLIPTAVTLVTARNAQGEDRVATIAWAMPISHEPSMIAVAIRPQGSTAAAIRESGHFIVNVLPANPAAIEIATTCGTKKGIDDRITQAHLMLAEGLEAPASRVNQAISWLECELVESKIHGDHELFIGRTLSATTRGELDENGKLIPPEVMLMGQRACFGHFEEGFSS